MKAFLPRQAISFLRKWRFSSHPSIYRNAPSIQTPFFSSSSSHLILPIPNLPTSISFCSSLHSLQPNNLIEADDNDEDDTPMNEFLSRFVWIIRGKLSETYPDCNKETIDSMLLIIIQKVVSEMERGGLDEMLDSATRTQSLDFSQDLWKTVWEVCNSVLDDMRKAHKKEEMKKFLQAEDVKDMCHFAGDVGIRGDMLRELRFKWAREKMEESEFYQSLERLRKEAHQGENAESEDAAQVINDDSSVTTEENSKAVALPQRRGKIKYKIYGLDLSSPKWAEVADRIHEAEKLITPEEPKLISGKCKMVTERILTLTEEDDLFPLLAEWVELLQPSRIDWLALLDKMKEHNIFLYFKVAEFVLNEKSFMTNIRDYSKLIDAHAKENRREDAERILHKMTEKGIDTDILTSTILVHMYSKAGNLDRVKDAFEKLRSQGFQPDMRAYNSMIMAYVNAGLPKSGESLMREMEARDIKPSKEIYMELLRAFAQRGHVDGAQRIVNTMQFAGFQPTLESCTLLVEAYGQAGDPDQARNNFDYMIKAGHKPDDRSTASMIAAYEKKNLLDKALNLLLDLEKDGFEPGVATYTVLVDWLGKLQLVDEAEQLLQKIVEKGETPFKIHVSLCDMYSRAGTEKKAREALGILESKKELLRADEFERIINGLLAGGLVQDARRVHELMQGQGFVSSEPLKVALMAAQAIPRQRPRAR
ncbi:pentatricopeptide repeat-containing protein At1g71060, mitochondrial [Magnolia sinica]|uniref:pentatricopeptide repeat-containing protein At1g71060, mitochondrial n=1 Tax=Magnolia sinica TaxID=86752 RepID=UPI00265AC2B1|nr:pentatricopeptide repeat-containing protein At1g71060, mitochondrial [Magnolia sinica]